MEVVVVVITTEILIQILVLVITNTTNTYIGRGVLVGWLVGVQRAAAINVQILESLLSSS